MSWNRDYTDSPETSTPAVGTIYEAPWGDRMAADESSPLFPCSLS